MPMCVYLYINIFIYLILKYFDGYNLKFHSCFLTTLYEEAQEFLFKYLYYFLRYLYLFTCLVMAIIIAVPGCLLAFFWLIIT